MKSRLNLLVLALFAVAVVGGCGEKDVDPNKGLPPSDLKPDMTKPASKTNPGAAETATPL